MGNLTCLEEHEQEIMDILKPIEKVNPMTKVSFNIKYNTRNTACIINVIHGMRLVTTIKIGMHTMDDYTHTLRFVGHHLKIEGFQNLKFVNEVNKASRQLSTLYESLIEN